MRLTLILASSVCALAAGQVAAQSEPGARRAERGPEAIFDAGVRAMERSDWIAAEILFREALEQDASERTRLNLAEALEHQGELLAARAEAQAVADGEDLLLREAASMMLGRIDRGLSELRLEARGIDPDDASFRLDGRVVEARSPITVDPGTHTLTLLRDGEPIAEREVTLARGARRAIAMEADLSPEAAARAAAEIETPRLLGGPAARRRRRRRLAIGISAAVAVVACVTIGLAIGLRDDSPDGGGTTRGRASGGLTYRFP